MLTGIMFAGLLTTGTLGYMLIENWTFLDALYQTVTTVTTVGFREVHPLSRAGQVFTMLLILAGVGMVFYTLTAVVTMAVEGELGEYFGRQRMRGRISGMRDHYLVCGFGRVGQEIARELHARNAPFVVVDNNPEVLPHLRELGYDFVPGDATQDEVLIEAGIQRAAGLLAAADSDTDNTYIVLSARALNPSLFIVARASRQSLEAKMLQAGANRVILPYAIAGRHMAFTAIQPAMYDFMTTTFQSREGDVILAELTVTPQSGLAERSLGEILGERTGVTVLALRRHEGAITAGPPLDTVLALHDQLIVLGPADQLESFATRTGATVPLGSDAEKAGKRGGHRIRIIGLSRRDAPR
jgi:voltage-gated potassium channel